MPLRRNPSTTYDRTEVLRRSRPIGQRHIGKVWGFRDCASLTLSALQNVGVDRHDYCPRRDDDGSGNHRKKRHRSRFC